jgi:RecJ-like exonuclease
MKKEMIKFVSENFEVIKNNFYKSELNILEEILETEGDQNEFDFLVEFLNNQMNVSTTEELIDAINERSLGVDYDDENDVNQLFDMIKALKEASYLEAFRIFRYN